VEQLQPGFGGFNTLNGVAATSAASAWAVGSYDNGPGTSSKTLIVRWNGTKRKRRSSPSPNGSFSNTLFGVAATSAANVWAAGTGPALFAHWNGPRGKTALGPDLSFSTLFGAATSAANVWAVGAYSDGGTFQTLALHCC
jgi:hypothetical protein